MNNEIDASVEKGAERLSELTICRTRGGIRIYGKVHPLIEDLIKSWSATEPVPVSSTYGRNWVGRDDKPVASLVWELQENPGVLSADGGVLFVIDRCGGPLTDERQINDPYGGRPKTAQVLNLSFLRIVGISEGDGIDIIIKGVFGTDRLLEIVEQIKRAIRYIAVQYIKPVDVTIIVSMQRNQ